MSRLELQALHRVRRRFIIERTAVVNQMRALLLEHGIVIPLGRALFARRLPAIFEDAENGLSPRLVALLHRLRRRWLALDVEIDETTRELVEWADQSELCRRATTVPGIGPMIATAVVAAVGNGQMFSRGRGMAAWLGLVPRQYTTGGKPTLGANQQARKHVPPPAIRPRRPGALRAHEARPLVPRRMAPPGRRAQSSKRRGGRARQQDGPHLLEGAHQRAGV